MSPAKHQIDYLIIGQGISGTFLSWYLRQEGQQFLVIDDNDPASASRAAAGIINPVTGRRYATVWMAEEILPFAWNAYQQLGHALQVTAITQKNIIDFFPSPQMRLSFLERMEESGPYLFAYPDQNDFNDRFNFDFGCGEIKPVYTAHLETILPAWRRELIAGNVLWEEQFAIDELEVNASSIHYRDIESKKIIFCDGNNGWQNRYFKALPFAPNKGEALIVAINDLHAHTIYKKGMLLSPLAEPGLFWLGSNYEWEFEDAKPSAAFRERSEQLLKSWLRIPFSILDHRCAIRPATLERRPFVGFHPHYPAMGILNGMGTKGCSLAPFFAKQLVDHLVHGYPLQADASIQRFSRLLVRT